MTNAYENKGVDLLILNEPGSSGNSKIFKINSNLLGKSASNKANFPRFLTNFGDIFRIQQSRLSVCFSPQFSPSSRWIFINCFQEGQLVHQYTAQDIENALNESLRALKTSYVDLYQVIHQPKLWIGSRSLISAFRLKDMKRMAEDIIRPFRVGNAPFETVPTLQ